MPRRTNDDTPAEVLNDDTGDTTPNDTPDVGEDSPELAPANTGDGPASTDTSGEFPADDVREGEGEGEGEVEGDTGDGPESTDTCGQFPATEVRASFVAEYGPGGGGGDGPNIRNLNPPSYVAGSTAPPWLQCNGSGFTAECVVELDGAAVETFYTNVAQVSGVMPDPVPGAGTLNVTVRDPATDAESNTMPLTIT